MQLQKEHVYLGKEDGKQVIRKKSGQFPEQSMNRFRNRLMAGALAAAMAGSMGVLPASAATTIYNQGVTDLQGVNGAFTHLEAGGWKTGSDKTNYEIGKNPSISKDIIDRGMTGSITIYKLDEENGNTSEGDGMYHDAANDKYGENNVTTDNNRTVTVDGSGNTTIGTEDRSTVDRDGIPNIIFSTAKIADIVNVTGQRQQSLKDVQDNPGLEDGSTSGEVGVYYGNLDSGFTKVAKKCGINVEDYSTVIDGDQYWSTEQMEAMIEKIKDANGDSNTWTGESLLNQYIEDAALATNKQATKGTIAPTTKGKDFAATGSQLSDDKKAMYYNGSDTQRNQDKGKTVMTDMDLGLYVVAETGFYEYSGIDANGNKKYEKVYRDYVYDDDGHEKQNTTSVKQKQSNAAEYADTDKSVTNGDQNYNDDTDVEQKNARNDASQRYSESTPDNNGGAVPNYGTGDFQKVEDGTQNPYVIDTPCSPFLVGLPQTNLADISKDGTVYKAGTVWQYDLNVYPKNNMTSITKKVVADDGDTLTERQDYHIGQNIHQVIYADSPVTMFTKSNGTANEARRNKEYKVSDTMSKGLTFQRVTRVALRGRIANPTKLSDFDQQSTDQANATKYDTDIEFKPGEDYKIIYTLNTGAKYVDSIDKAQPKTVTNNEYTENTSIVGKYYADADGNVPDYNLIDKSESSLKGTVAQPNSAADVVPNIDPAEKTDFTKNHSSDGKVADGAIGTHVNTGDNKDGIDGAVANGDEYVQSFTIELTDKGLEKLDNQKVASQVIVEFDTVLNKNAVIGSQDGKTFNTNRPTLTWRNQNSLERKVEGNQVHIFTYELDLTKVGQSTKGTKDINGKQVTDDHIFDAGDVAFSVQQEKQLDPNLAKNTNIETKNAYMLFVQDRDANGDLIDGSYHVWTPADGAIEGIITADTLKKDSNGKTDANNSDPSYEEQKNNANGLDTSIKDNKSKDADMNAEDGKTQIQSSKETAGSQDAAIPSRDNDSRKNDKDNINTNADGSTISKAGESFDDKFTAADRDPVTGLRTVDGVRYNSAKFAVTEVSAMTEDQLKAFSSKTMFEYKETTKKQANSLENETDAVDQVWHEDFKGYGYNGDTNTWGQTNGMGQTESHKYGMYKTTSKDGKVCLATTDVTPTKTCVVTQLVSPAHTDTTIANATDSSKAQANANKQSERKQGLLRIRGLDSESYILTEKATSSHFNLLKNRFKVTLNSTDPKDGNLIPNAAGNDKALKDYGAALTMDDGTVALKSVKVVPLTHNSGIVKMSVENYKTITLHTGGSGTWYFYVIAAGLAGCAVLVTVSKRKKRKAA